MSSSDLNLGVFADLHCGHVLGLVPPKWFVKKNLYPEVYKLQRKSWEYFVEGVDMAGPYDMVVWNGDVVDGLQPKGEATDLITHEPREQIDIACEIVKYINAPVNVFVSGTGYHTKVARFNFEKEVAARFGCKAEPEVMINANGKSFYFRHKIDGSSVPYGNHTPLAKMQLNQFIKASAGKAPKADILVFSHTHKFGGAYGDGWEALTTPCLQINSNHGRMTCNGDTTWGFIWFNVQEDGNYTLGKYTKNISTPMKMVTI